MKKRMRRFTAIALVTTMLFSITGCNQVMTPQGTEDIYNLDVKETTDEMEKSSMDFAVKILQETVENEEELASKQGSDSVYSEDQKRYPYKNTLISPISVYMALSMVTNGADAETLAELEEVLGLSVEDLNSFSYNFLSNTPDEEEYRLHIANALWYTDEEKFTVNEDFVKNVAMYYNATATEKNFKNPNTVADINQWVDEQTDGMIDRVLDDISEDAVMILVNALAFEAKWEDVYADTDIRSSCFMTEDETMQDVDFMHSEESLYLEDESAKGFIKYYKDKKYAFVALLPNEGVTLSDYVKNLSGAHLEELLENPIETTVDVAIPQFEVDYEVTLNDILTVMGIEKAFSEEDANFTKLGVFEDENIFISKVLHKTHLEVDQDGTKGAATTTVILEAAGAAPDEERKVVHLNRPFLYMIIDCETNQPIFMGTMYTVE